MAKTNNFKKFRHVESCMLNIDMVKSQFLDMAKRCPFWDFRHGHICETLACLNFRHGRKLPCLKLRHGQISPCLNFQK